MTDLRRYDMSCEDGIPHMAERANGRYVRVTDLDVSTAPSPTPGEAPTDLAALHQHDLVRHEDGTWLCTICVGRWPDTSPGAPDLAALRDEVIPGEPYYRAIHESGCAFRLAGAPHPCTCATAPIDFAALIDKLLMETRDEARGSTVAMLEAQDARAAVEQYVASLTGARDAAVRERDAISNAASHVVSMYYDGNLHPHGSSAVSALAAALAASRTPTTTGGQTDG